MKHTFGGGLATAALGVVVGCGATANEDGGAGGNTTASVSSSTASGAGGAGAAQTTGTAGAGGTSSSSTGGTGGGGGNAMLCQPSAGDAQTQASCDIVRVAVIRGAQAKIQLSARVSVNRQACAVIDTIILGNDESAQNPQDVWQTIDDVGVPADGNYFETIVDIAAAPAIDALCDDDAVRFNPFGFIARGRVDGGTFEARCGPAAGLSAIVDVVITCHQGIQRDPNLGNGIVDISGQVYTTVDTFFPRDTDAGILTAVDSVVRVMPSASVEAFDSGSWQTDLQQSTNGSLPTTTVAMYFDGDAFGASLCTVPSIEPEAVLPVPFIMRIGGQTQAGPFTSEIFVDQCARLGGL